MMKTSRIVVSLLLLLTCGAALAADRPKFRAAGADGASIGHYLVTLAGNATADDVAAMQREATIIYGAQLDAGPSAVRQFAATMTPAHAKLLSTDPRISEVAETPRSRPSAAPAAVPSSGRRLTPHTSGYGDNGQSGTYTYDSSGNITAIGADTYLYDAENRLTISVTRGVTETYTYDAFGNRKSATGATNCLGQTICAQPVTVDNTRNRLMTINTAAVHYDPPGNVYGIDAIAGSPATVYTYDGTEMMTGSTVGSDVRQYVYTADDERIAVKGGASWTWTVRDLNKKVLREFTSLESGSNFAMTNQAWIKDYVWRDGVLLATTTSTGTLHYHLDHLGTPRLITDANAVKVAEHAYHPFGAEIDLTPHENPEEAMKFTGHERDIVAGDGHTLDYMHARFDNVSLGRFLSVDPVTGNLHSPQAWNRFSYVGNTPMIATDPTGMVASGSAWDHLPENCKILCDDKPDKKGSHASQDNTPHSHVAITVRAKDPGWLSAFLFRAKLRLALGYMHRPFTPAEEAAMSGKNYIASLLMRGARLRPPVLGSPVVIGPTGALATDIELADGYYQYAGAQIRFSEYYYNRLWATGRPAPFLAAQEVLDTATNIEPDVSLPGFNRYTNGTLEMIYNPATGEVWHLQPLR